MATSSQEQRSAPPRVPPARTAGRGRWRKLAARVLRSRETAVVAVLLAASLVLVYPAVLGGRVLAPEDSLLFRAPFQSLHPASLARPSNHLLGDSVEVFHPDLEWVRTALRGGRLPLWDPSVFAGWPILASQQTAMLFPLSVLAYVLPFWFSLGLIVVLKVILAGLGVWLLCRALGLRAASGGLAAVSYALGSYFVLWLDHPQTNVWLMLPWLLLAVRRVTRGGDRRGVALLGAAIGLTLLGGHPESVVIVALPVLGFVLAELIGRGAPGRLAGSRSAILVRLAAGAVLGGLCGLVVLAPFVEQLGQSTQLARGGTNLPHASLLSLFLPDLWGRPDTATELAGPANYAERTLYIGALPLLLAAAGLYRGRWREQRFFLLAAAGSVAVAVRLPGLGRLPELPVLDNVALSRALIVTSLSLAMLAAYGLESFLAGDIRHRRRMLGIAAVVALVPVVWSLGRLGLLGRLPRFGDLAPTLGGRTASGAETGAGALTRWILAAGVGLGLLSVLGRGWRPALALVLLLGWCTVDLEALNHGYQPAVSQALAAPPPAPSMRAALAAQGHGRIAGLGRYLIPNVGERYGLRDVRGHELPSNRRFLDLFHYLGGSGNQATRLFTNAKTGRLLDTFGVRLLLAGPGARPTLPQLRPLAVGADGGVYLNTTVLPRAYLAAGWRRSRSEVGALATTYRSSRALLRTAPVVEHGPPGPRHTPAGPDRSSVSFVVDGADEVKLRVGSLTGGYLVLLDSYYPGWGATVDGRPTPIRAANAAFRAVMVRPGVHVVDFRYRPASIVLGGLASLVGWIAVLLGTVLPSRRRAPGRGAAARRPARARPDASGASPSPAPPGVVRAQVTGGEASARRRRMMAKA